MFHSLDGSIADRLVETAEGLGGATRLAVASPFWDGGVALDRLCKGLGLEEAFVHAHGTGVVEGTAGGNWPTSSRCRVNAVRVAVLDDENDRRLHAKVFEVVCRRGRILLSGSANATGAALNAGRNVEACVARIHRNVLVGWSLSPGAPLEPIGAPDEAAEDSGDNVGVLRASLEGDRIAGQILSPHLTGAAEVFQLGAGGAEQLGEAIIDNEGFFAVDAPGLEVQSWKSGRLVIRASTTSGRSAEGFVSVAALAHLARRAGPMLPRLLEFLTGTEMPADVAAIVSWMHEDPTRLGSSPNAFSGGGADGEDRAADARVPLSELIGTSLPGGSGPHRTHGSGEATWARFMRHFFNCLRESRGPLGGTGSSRGGGDDGVGPKTPSIDPAVDRAFANYERLLDEWLAPAKAAQLGVYVFVWAIYLCDALNPEAAQAHRWLEALLEKLPRSSATDALREEFAAVALTLLGLDPTPQGARRARARLMRFGVDLDHAAPKEECAPGPRAVLNVHDSYADLWSRVLVVRTLAEQACAYVDALNGRTAACGYADLAAECPEEWPVLAEALTSDRASKRVLPLEAWTEACPRCHSVLPSAEVHKLRHRRVASARNCCGRIVVFGGALDREA